ncbi:hypothetical protein VTJ49DRAFT_6148 [Mycothermus thermophilus]|uniref:Dynein light chain n=1 Tax=Humicola insolens TaxID=85995 RepID=A0ABR3V394_HUMIN
MAADEGKNGVSAAASHAERLEAQIKSADMTEDMQQEVVEVAQEAMAKFSIEKDIAQHIKRTFDERKGPTWHCIVGRNFGSFVTHGATLSPLVLGQSLAKDTFSLTPGPTKPAVVMAQQRRSTSSTSTSATTPSCSSRPSREAASSVGSRSCEERRLPPNTHHHHHHHHQNRLKEAGEPTLSTSTRKRKRTEGDTVMYIHSWGREE